MDISQPSFSTRPLEIPESLIADIQSGKKSLTSIMHENWGDLDDYRALKKWEKELRQKSNWVGNTILFNFVVEYWLKSKNGHQNYTQTMFLDEDNKRQGFIRLAHLSRDTETRRKDCTKIEETLVNGTQHLRNISLFKAMYNFAINQSDMMHHARVITELGVGLSPKKYGILVRRIKRLENKKDNPQKTLSVEENQQLEFDRFFLEKDWVTATIKFIQAIGFEITDIALPQDENSDSTPQVRISKAVPGRTPLPLPPYKMNKRDCFVCHSKDDLIHLYEGVRDIKQKALDHNA